jgi:hypothetical protein
VPNITASFNDPRVLGSGYGRLWKMLTLLDELSHRQQKDNTIDLNELTESVGSSLPTVNCIVPATMYNHRKNPSCFKAQPIHHYRRTSAVVPEIIHEPPNHGA